MGFGPRLLDQPAASPVFLRGYEHAVEGRTCKRGVIGKRATARVWGFHGLGEYSYPWSLCDDGRRRDGSRRDHCAGKPKREPSCIDACPQLSESKSYLLQPDGVQRAVVSSDTSWVIQGEFRTKEEVIGGTPRGRSEAL